MKTESKFKIQREKWIERRLTDEMKQVWLRFWLDIFQYLNHKFCYRISNLMIQDDLKRRLTGLQLLCWSLFLILSFDKWYSAINTPTNCRSELNIHLKSSLNIRGLQKLPDLLIFILLYPLHFSYKYLHSKGKGTTMQR